jgi:RNA ligase (TIGR02306 family)
MSTHYVNVIEVSEIREHPNAHSLDIIPVGNFQAVVRKGTFQIGDKAVYIEPDYVVPTYRKEFEFLAKPNKQEHRLKAVRLRGEISHGLLIPVPDDVRADYAIYGGVGVGDNLMNDLEIKRWEPEQRLVMSGDVLSYGDWPAVDHIGKQKFDVEGWRYHDLFFKPGETVIVTEKVHGANARYVWLDDRLYVGSRNRWLKVEGNHIWSRVLSVRPDIEKWCREHPGTILYGEIYGKVQSLKYGIENDIDFIAFAAYDTVHGTYVDSENLFSSMFRYDMDHVPILYKGPFIQDVFDEIKERDSILAEIRGLLKHMMEGVVITPVTERWEGGQRACVKLISDRYWEFID